MQLTKHDGKYIWKRVFDYFKPKGPVTAKTLDKMFKEVYNDMNRLWQNHEQLAQDQYAKAALGEIRRLEDRITSAFMEWDKTIEGFHKRISALEEKRNAMQVQPRRIKKPANRDVPLS